MTPTLTITIATFRNASSISRSFRASSSSKSATSRRRHRRHRKLRKRPPATLGDKASPIFYSPAQLPEPSITFAIEPKTAPTKDKIGVSIHKNPGGRSRASLSRDPQTKEFLLPAPAAAHRVVVAKHTSAITLISL